MSASSLLYTGAPNATDAEIDAFIAELERKYAESHPAKEKVTE